MAAAIRSGFLAGLIAGLITTSAMYLGWLTGGIPAVVMALWERQLRLIPMSIFSFLIVRLKFAAKPAAFWGMLAGLVLLWGGIGALVARWSSPRPLMRAAWAWVAAAAVLLLLAYRPAMAFLTARQAAAGITVAAGGTVLAAIAGYALLFALLFGLIHPRLPQRQFRVASESGITRREMLSRGLILIVASAAGTAAAQWLAAGARRVAAAAQSALGRVKDGLPAEITPSSQFYVVSKNPPGFDPVVDAAKWSLQVGGLVPHPLRLTYDDLRAMPAVEQFQTLECISNEVGGDLISNAKWRGVRLRDVLMRAGGPGAKAVKVAFRCADGYSESVPIGDAMNPTTLLAYEMNGEPLPTAHGFPVRLLIPGLFGMKNPKWITKIDIVDYDFQGYWEASGWSDEAVVKTMSKFVPLNRTYPFEEIGIGGVAYAGDRGIKEVEYSTDGGKTWQKAEVKPPLGQFTWVLWAAIWKPTGPGQYTLRVRAKDGQAVVQTEKQTPTLPDGASGYHTIRVRIKK